MSDTPSTIKARCTTELPAGLILIDKPYGLSSAQTISKIKKCLHKTYQKVKIGHTGTLDPAATGLMIAVTGRATKLSNFIEATEKAYKGSFIYGALSNTEDYAGTITFYPRQNRPKANALMKIAQQQLSGTISQVPPKFSALKVSGRRAYQLARSGQNVAMKSRKVSVSSFVVGDANMIGFKDDLSFAVTCSKGTYIRSLIRDLGILSENFLLLRSLCRTAVGQFGLDKDRALLTVADAGTNEFSDVQIISWEQAFTALPKHQVSPQEYSWLLNGCKEYLAKLRGQLGVELIAESQGADVLPVCRIYAVNQQAPALGLLLNNARTDRFEFWSAGI